MMSIEIETGIVIDKPEELLEGLNTLSRIWVEEDSSVYLWLDTGLVNDYGTPIFISLLKTGSGYVGHYYGTADKLTQPVKSLADLKRFNLEQCPRLYRNHQWISGLGRR